MAAPLHPAASHNLPLFVTAPGETDWLMAVTGVILFLAILMFGLVFLRLHTLPERMAHRTNKLQFEIVAVLGLLALLTHVHWFWVAGLFLALIDIPDFGDWLGRMTAAVERIAGVKQGDRVLPAAPGETIVNATQAEATALVPGETISRSTPQKEPSHA